MSPPELHSSAWERLECLFDELIGLPDRDRAARLAELRTEDPALAREVTSLVASAPLADDFFGRLPLAAAAVAAELVSSGSDPAADRAAGAWVDHHPGRLVAQYHVGDTLGRGGMGVVYRGVDTRLGRPVALKFLPAHLWVDRAARERFLVEARATAALDHPNICTVYEVGETSEGALFLAMALYDGETLRERLARAPLGTDAALDVATQAAQALSAAHARGIVHRDVKPANLMLTSTGTVKLLDFGLARLPDVTVTASGQTPGTIAYMSPEQVRGRGADARSDLWALGVVLFEMLTGQRPFRGDSDAAMLHAILTQPVDMRRAPTGGRAAPKAMARVVEQLLRKEPAERYRSADELLADLSALGTRAPVPRRANSRWLRMPGTRRMRVEVAALVLTALVASAAGVLSWRGSAGRREKGVAAATEVRVISLAVLPLKNYSGDATEEYFADGMTEALTTTLTKLEALRVIAHQSVRQFKRSDRPVPEIARALGVTHVVDGSVLQNGDSVRITATLIDATRNTPIWADRFVRGRREILALQQEVALAIARAIEVALTPRDRERLADAPEVDPEVFDLYIKGTQARYTLDPLGGGDASVPEGYFTRAIARDSGYAPAYAGLASMQALSNDPTRARRFAEKALALDPDLAEPHVVLGLIREHHERDWSGAEGSFRQAIRLNPGFAEAHHELSMLLTRRGRFDEALAAAQRTLYLAPMSARFHHGLGEVYLWSGRYNEAVRAAADARARDSSWSGTDLLLGAAYAGMGEYRSALAALERFRERVGGGVCIGDLGYVYAASGQRDRAREVLKACEAGARNPNSGWTANQIATIYMVLGDREQALRWLERAVKTRPETMVYLAVDRNFRPLRAEPRFQALLKKMRLDE